MAHSKIRLIGKLQVIPVPERFRFANDEQELDIVAVEGVLQVRPHIRTATPWKTESTVDWACDAAAKGNVEAGWHLVHECASILDDIVNSGEGLQPHPLPKAAARHLGRFLDALIDARARHGAANSKALAEALQVLGLSDSDGGRPARQYPEKWKLGARFRLVKGVLVDESAKLIRERLERNWERLGDPAAIPASAYNSAVKELEDLLPTVTPEELISLACLPDNIEHAIRNGKPQGVKRVLP